MAYEGSGAPGRVEGSMEEILSVNMFKPNKRKRESLSVLTTTLKYQVPEIDFTAIHCHTWTKAIITLRP